ncbi:outer membrane beta-barrel family protein [Pedobacter rhizosphaerae]|uniref:Outer membrane receptor proteins, mostly Fe transport n=1 Tax=Pedobacter rhizosphaerae TaxID=390241 RepID=A0A1H9IN11_9SPHI|nr:outer membrane beta-barrel family protein [Pedobacter rhizosphaerae]SEQ75909.1 Outer membrane receptor proteins, mostly Fe transport [Pedobacter rhizosphaerae]
MKPVKYWLTILHICWSFMAIAQTKSIQLLVIDEQKRPISNATVQLLVAGSQNLIQSNATDSAGQVLFYEPQKGDYLFKIIALGYNTQLTKILKSPFEGNSLVINMKMGGKNLSDVTISGKKQLIQHTQGKTIVNVDAAVTNTGTTVLELLEKSPGVMVDKNGGLSLQGKSSVLVMIDDKQTYLSGTELNNLLSNMSSSQVNQIELITNPSAKYDASGNAGIINIKTKKNKQEGFNGSIMASAGQGKYYKNNNNLMLNYRKGRVNVFANYSLNLNKSFTDIYAYRQYFSENGTVEAILDQPTTFFSKNNGHLLKTGLDIYASDKTTIGLTLTGNLAGRLGNSEATATWKNAAAQVDSAVATYSNTDFKLQNAAINLNLRQSLSKSQDLSIDLDALKYDIDNDQVFTNKLLAAGGYSRGSVAAIPSSLKIFAAKVDHTLRIGKKYKLESGFKSSSISTDNIADYQLFDGTSLSEDLNKSNHFLYKEHINALYSSLETKWGKFNIQAGLRYENTNYDAHQLGNSIKPDSAFSRTYSNLFPSGYISYEADSLNTFSFTVSRRIDRPAYQKLNPFVFIINKYTYQRGNPFFLPQYSWNLELSHQFKQLLSTTFSYSRINDYFSQLFLSEGTDILVYTEGNVGKVHNLSLSIALQVSPWSWWSVNAQSTFNRKELKGYQNVNYSSSINQLQSSLSNQFTINKGLSAELSGYYITKARNDLQELLYPTGQVSLGLAQTILKGKGSLKLSARDIFYTQAMEGLTDFPGANEYFILTRDSRVINLAFTYRFGKPLKAAKRSSGSATDEMNRAGS